MQLKKFVDLNIYTLRANVNSHFQNPENKIGGILREIANLRTANLRRVERTNTIDCRTKNLKNGMKYYALEV